MAVGVDAVLNQAPEAGEVLYDFVMEDGDIKSADQLDTAILVSLFSDKRAEPYEIVLPQLRRGSVIDLETPDDVGGSKLWLLEQARLTSETVAKATTFARSALQWMVRDLIATTVTAESRISQGDLNLLITVMKPNSRSETAFVALWDGTGK